MLLCLLALTVRSMFGVQSIATTGTSAQVAGQPTSSSLPGEPSAIPPLVLEVRGVRTQSPKRRTATPIHLLNRYRKFLPGGLMAVFA